MTTMTSRSTARRACRGVSTRLTTSTSAPRRAPWRIGSSPVAARMTTVRSVITGIHARAEAVGGSCVTGYGAVPGQSGWGVQVRVPLR